MDPADRHRLLAEWHSNESALQRLANLPAGPADPAARERELDERQDEIEFKVGEEWWRERRAREP